MWNVSSTEGVYVPPTARVEERRLWALNYARKYGSVAVGNMRRRYPSVGAETLRTDLRWLLAERLVSKHGNNRGRFYKPVNGTEPQDVRSQGVVKAVQHV